ncbi:hypothetical protein AYI70_g8190 [Smittium culicis]|uniref:Uncharacterized protein n=1 Tax=Smittium culicis TaxID=133412 RepID=A0A1R1XH51_9FUNG|nr:hypothetical protein AYI70_g8190 [Smittium culicis]
MDVFLVEPYLYVVRTYLTARFTVALLLAVAASFLKYSIEDDDSSILIVKEAWNNCLSGFFLYKILTP